MLKNINGRIYKQIPEERIKHFGEDDGKPIETTPFETVINANNEEDRKILESL